MILLPISDAERKSAEALAEGGNPIFLRKMSWSSKTNGSNSTDLVMADRNRVYIIRKHKRPLKGHLYDLQELQSIVSTACWMKFKELELSVVGDQEAVDDLIAVIRTNIVAIYHNFPAEKIPQLDIRPDSRNRSTTPDVPLKDPISSFLDVYTAACTHLDVEFSHTFGQLIAAKGIADVITDRSFELSIDELSGLDLDTEDSSRLNPVIEALKYDMHFKSIHIDQTYKHAMKALSQVAESNKAIEKWTFTDVTTTDGFSGFVEALGRNKETCTKHIVIKDCNIKERGLNGVVEGLSIMSSGLERLTLSNCGFTSKCVVSLVKALSANELFSTSLKYLDLSHNSFGKEGTQSITEWFSGGNVSIQRLLLANCSLDLTPFLLSLKRMDLIELNLSQHRFEKLNIQALTVIVEMSTRLEKLVLQSCGLDATSLAIVLESFAVNKKLKSVALDLSKNDMKLEGAKLISEYFPKLNSIHSLNLADCKLKSEGMKLVFSNLHKMKSLRGLDISCNMKMSFETVTILKSIADAVSDPNLPLETLVIRGNEKKFIGSELYSIFLVMSQSQLSVVDISGNRIGDKAGVTIAESLKGNQRLRYLNWDNNDLKVGAWNALWTTLETNKNITEVPTPVEDMQKAMDESATLGKDESKQTILFTLESIAKLLSERRREAPKLFSIPPSSRTAPPRKTVSKLTQEVCKLRSELHRESSFNTELWKRAARQPPLRERVPISHSLSTRSLPEVGYTKVLVGSKSFGNEKEDKKPIIVRALSPSRTSKIQKLSKKLVDVGLVDMPGEEPPPPVPPGF